MEYETDFKERFMNLKSVKDIISIRDIYVNKDNKHILYYPINNCSLGEVISKRTDFVNSGEYQLLGVEIIYRQISTQDSNNHKRTGLFRFVEYRDSALKSFSSKNNLNGTKLPPLMEKIKKHLEKDSKWLCGGPKPSEDYVKSES